ncbi:Hypothetical predicted protein [Scomber scombrus]|uniref:Uncharacterized protein n=1 Tax=Scomber scombrus TaxID=13677 RepID=A0AAV1NLX3_SCOSC
MSFLFTCLCDKNMSHSQKLKVFIVYFCPLLGIINPQQRFLWVSCDPDPPFFVACEIGNSRQTPQQRKTSGSHTNDLQSQETRELWKPNATRCCCWRISEGQNCLLICPSQWLSAAA